MTPRLSPLLLLPCCVGIIACGISRSKCFQPSSSSSPIVQEGYKCENPNNVTSCRSDVSSLSQIVPARTASATVQAPPIALTRAPILTSTDYATCPLKSYVVMPKSLLGSQTVQAEPTHANDVIVPTKSIVELGITLLTIVLGTSVSITCIACYLFKCRTERTRADALLFNNQVIREA